MQIEDDFVWVRVSASLLSLPGLPRQRLRTRRTTGSPPRKYTFGFRAPHTAEESVEATSATLPIKSKSSPNVRIGVSGSDARGGRSHSYAFPSQATVARAASHAASRDP